MTDPFEQVVAGNDGADRAECPIREIRAVTSDMNGSDMQRTNSYELPARILRMNTRNGVPEHRRTSR